jgi:hypothetical protein
VTIWVCNPLANTARNWSGASIVKLSADAPVGPEDSLRATGMARAARWIFLHERSSDSRDSHGIGFCIASCSLGGGLGLALWFGFVPLSLGR